MVRPGPVLPLRVGQVWTIPFSIIDRNPKVKFTLLNGGSSFCVVYVSLLCVLDRTHLDLPEEEKRRMRLEKGENIDPNKEVLKIASSALASNLGADQTPTSNNRGPKVHLTQVPPLTKFFTVAFSKISLICLEGKLMTPHREGHCSFLFLPATLSRLGDRPLKCL